MAFNAFVGGIEPGGLTSSLEVKLIICYLLDNIGQPLSFDTLNEILQGSGLVNYFAFAEAMSELCRAGHIEPAQGQPDSSQATGGEEPLYLLTESGRKMVETFVKMIPKSAREKALTTARRLTDARRCMDKVEITSQAVSDGYVLRVVMQDIGSDLLDLKVFLPGQEECLRVKENIERDPSGFYERLLHDLVEES